MLPWVLGKEAKVGTTRSCAEGARQGLVAATWGQRLGSWLGLLVESKGRGRQDEEGAAVVSDKGRGEIN